MNVKDEKMLIIALELMSDDKLYTLFELIVEEMNKRKAEHYGRSGDIHKHTRI